MKKSFAASSVLISSLAFSSAKGMIEIPLQKRNLVHSAEDGPRRMMKPRKFQNKRTAATPRSLLSTNNVGGDIVDNDGDQLSYEMTNVSNAQYYGSLYLGSSSVKKNFIFDTGSPWLWVATTECKANCHTQDTYDTASSIYYNRVSETVKELLYEQGYAAGYIAEDQFCLGLDDVACADEFLFVEVEETDELDGLRSNGVLGLSPDVTEYNTA